MSKSRKPARGADNGGGSNRVSRLSRRQWMGLGLGGVAVALVGDRWWRARTPDAMVPGTTPITVYASPSCGCCGSWMAHLRDNGFHVTVVSLADVAPVKRQLGIPEQLWSCHSGMVAGYAVEGHVPADLLRRVLGERPAIAGLSVPGMPSGSPGMEGATRDRYNVIAFTSSGQETVYATR